MPSTVKANSDLFPRREDVRIFIQRSSRLDVEGIMGAPPFEIALGPGNDLTFGFRFSAGLVLLVHFLGFGVVSPFAIVCPSDFIQKNLTAGEAFLIKSFGGLVFQNFTDGN